MDQQHHDMTPKERVVRLSAGLGLVAIGCIGYAISQAYDPQNRAALIGIIAIFMGLTWVGQGIRGYREPVPSHREEVQAPTTGPISAERTVIGLLAAWVVPGLGHIIIGRRAKGLLIFVTITITFAAGVLMAEGRNLNYDRSAVYFLAYIFNVGETGLGWLLTRDLEYDHAIRFLQVGFLYTAVASLLNLVAMMDFVSTCTRSVTAAQPRTAGGTDMDVPGVIGETEELQ